MSKGVVLFALFGDVFSRLILLFCCMVYVLCEFLDVDIMGRSFHILHIKHICFILDDRILGHLILPHTYSKLNNYLTNYKLII